jgi:hypothetical protein
MLNVNQITSQLAKMPDNALQQYATMHKADPYMLALTIAESNRRKQMRSAAQGAQGAMPQPKVADQAIAGMSPQQLPENVGIGALPADNIKGMATGGIVAFEEGGHVPRFSGDTDGSVVYDPVTGMPLFNPSAKTTGPEVEGGASLWERMGLGNAANRKTLEKLDRDLKDRKAYDPKLATRRENFAGYTPVKDEEALKKGLGSTAVAAKTASSAPAAAPGAGAYTPSSLADMMKEVNPEIEKMNAEDRKAMDPFRTQFETERSDLAKRKESNKAEALLAAGLGMMSGTSRNALQNIGAGASQGLASLKEANRSDDAAKRALMQSEMHLAQAEMQGRKGNFQNMNALANQARQEKQFATSSELQRQQITQQGEYQRGMVGAANARNSAENKLNAEITKLSNQAKDLAKADMRFLTATPAMQRQIIKEHFDSLAQNNPFIMRALMAQGAPQAADPLIRTLD